MERKMNGKYRSGITEGEEREWDRNMLRDNDWEHSKLSKKTKHRPQVHRFKKPCESQWDKK